MKAGIDIAQRAKEQLTRITGLAPDTVSGLSRDDEGWHVAVDMIEMKYIPNTKDVLATYGALLDSDGNLLRYQRTKRYRRDQAMEEA